MEQSLLAHNIYESGSLSYDSVAGGWNIDTNGIIPAGDWDQHPLTIDNYYNNYWYPYVYPTVTYYPEKSKIEQAFQILNKLMKKGVVQVNQVKIFVDLVSEIADCL